jgi:hypothetical protein
MPLHAKLMKASLGLRVVANGGSTFAEVIEVQENQI